MQSLKALERPQEIKRKPHFQAAQVSERSGAWNNKRARFVKASSLTYIRPLTGSPPPTHVRAAAAAEPVGTAGVPVR